MSYNDDSELIGLGRVGRVMRFGDIAVKTANVWTVPKGASETTIISYEQTNELNKQSLKHEGHVYSHLGHVPGVIKPYHMSDTEIRMPYLRQGSLSRYLRTHHGSVDNSQRLQWLQEAAHIVCRVHERRVLVVDIATRSFLLDEDLSLHMCDFTESTIVADDEDMAECISEDFTSVKSDIARFGSMMYEVISGNQFEFYVIPDIETDLDEDPVSKTYITWPTDDKLPITHPLFLGDIIKRCWSREGFLTMQEVCHALDNSGHKKPTDILREG